LVFGYVGIKQWDEFVETFDVSKSSQLPKLLVWDRNEEYELVSKASSVINIYFTGCARFNKKYTFIISYLLTLISMKNLMLD